MWCNQIFSQIEDGIVRNLIVADNYEVANQLAREIYGEDAIAVDSTQYLVSIGDKYINGNFYLKDGVTLIPRNNTAEEDAKEAKQKIEIYTEEVAEYAIELDYRLSTIELGL